MSTAELKTELIKNISLTHDLSKLQQIKQIFDIDYLQSDVRVFTTEERLKIEKALKQYENGECISNEEAEKEIQGWLDD